MAEQHRPSLESTLLRNLALAQNGDAEAASRVYANLKQLDPDRHADLLPTVRRLLTLDNADVQMSAAIWIGSLGEAAASAVPDLKRLAMSSPPLRDACVASLSAIPGDDSASAIVDVFEASNTTNYMTAYMMLSALERRAEDMGAHLPRLEAAAKRFDEESAEVVTRYLNQVRHARRTEAETDLSAVAFGSRVELRPEGFADTDPVAHFAPHKVELARAPGLAYEGRLPFEYTSPTTGEDLRGDVGVAVYRTTHSKPEFVVVISADADWYGESPQNCIEHLATACLYVCELNPATTVWVERWAAGSGLNKTEQDEQSVVLMQYDRENRAFHSPQWRTIRSLPDYLKDIGAVG